MIDRMFLFYVEYPHLSSNSNKMFYIPIKLSFLRLLYALHIKRREKGQKTSTYCQ